MLQRASSLPVVAIWRPPLPNCHTKRGGERWCLQCHCSIPHTHEVKVCSPREKVTATNTKATQMGRGQMSRLLGEAFLLPHTMLQHIMKVTQPPPFTT